MAHCDEIWIEVSLQKLYTVIKISLHWTKWKHAFYILHISAVVRFFWHTLLRGIQLLWNLPLLRFRNAWNHRIQMVINFIHNFMTFIYPCIHPFIYLLSHINKVLTCTLLLSCVSLSCIFAFLVRENLQFWYLPFHHFYNAEFSNFQPTNDHDSQRGFGQLKNIIGGLFPVIKNICFFTPLFCVFKMVKKVIR